MIQPELESLYYLNTLGFTTIMNSESSTSNFRHTGISTVLGLKF
ncbi:hypothetical protein MNBD_BACTEROID06-678 [hydrothermal vent metagenome]|uniref:Uncharacterized protein n=1 Tax=hydrothermal vent metagenome TaxID=652676 RepID=A0A3B0UDY2_9ZZZZ